MSVSDPRPARAPRVFSPFELNDMVDQALAENVGQLWIEGELVDVSERGGHVYFNLRDARASVRGVMFQSDVRRVRHLFEDGRMVRLRVSVGIFVPRGQFQIRAIMALPAGEGDRAAEVLKVRKKLAAEGLLSPERKRALPAWPKVVGVVTSRSAAALHDIVEVARRRMPVELVLAHASVQGIEAPDELVRALRGLAALQGLDVIIVARGGGASEDLSAFDDERVARAIAACPVPVVSGVGHEVDVTTVDLVADVRGATPSHATELTIPARSVYLAELERGFADIRDLTRDHLDRDARRLEMLRARIPDPIRIVSPLAKRLSDAREELAGQLRRRHATSARALEAGKERLFRAEPRLRLSRTHAALSAHARQLTQLMEARHLAQRQLLGRWREQLDERCAATVAKDRARLAALVARLEALSPLGVLGRGYAIALSQRTGKALVRARDAAPGDALELVLSEGRLEAIVRGTK